MILYLININNFILSKNKEKSKKKNFRQQKNKLGKEPTIWHHVFNMHGIWSQTW